MVRLKTTILELKITLLHSTFNLNENNQGRIGKKFKIIWEITECPLCHKLASPVKGVKICNIFSGVVEAIEIPRLPEWGASKIQVDEVECRADGDEKCKWVLIIEY